MFDAKRPLKPHPFVGLSSEEFANDPKEMRTFAYQGKIVCEFDDGGWSSRHLGKHVFDILAGLQTICPVCGQRLFNVDTFSNGAVDKHFNNFCKYRGRIVLRYIKHFDPKANRQSLVYKRN